MQLPMAGKMIRFKSLSTIVDRSHQPIATVRRFDSHDSWVHLRSEATNREFLGVYA